MGARSREPPGIQKKETAGPCPGRALSAGPQGPGHGLVRGCLWGHLKNWSKSQETQAAPAECEDGVSASSSPPHPAPTSRLGTAAAVSQGYGLERVRAHEHSLPAPGSEGSLTNWCAMEVQVLLWDYNYYFRQ